MKKTYTIPKPQFAFTGGEMSQEAYGRVDLDKFGYGLKRSRNFFVRASGGISNRAGTQFLSYPKYQDTPAILVPFSFNTEQSYILEFGEYYARVWMDGGLVLEADQSAVTVTGITGTNTSPAVFNPAAGAAHGLTVNTVVDVSTQPSGTNGSAVLTNGSRWQVASVASAVALTGVTYALNTTVTTFTKTAHGLNVGDLVYASNFAGLDSASLNGKQWRVRSTPLTSTFTLENPDTGAVFKNTAASGTAGTAGKLDAHNFTLKSYPGGVTCSTAGKAGGASLGLTTVLSASANAASPCVITTVNPHGYATGDWVYPTGFTGTIGDMINNKLWVIDVTSTTQFSLYDIDGNAVDTTGLTGGLTGATNRVYEITTPYSAADLTELNYDAQSADTMVLTHRSYKPRVLTRTAHNAWSITSYTPAPLLAAPTNFTATNGGVAGNTPVKYKVCAVADGSYEEGLPATASMTTGKAEQGGSINGYAYYNVLTFDIVAGAIRYNIYRSWNGGEFTYIGSSAQPTSGSTAKFEDQVTIAATQAIRIDPPPPDTPLDPFAADGDYPGCATYHEQRLWFAGANNDPQTVWATQIGNYYNMNRVPPVSAEDAIELTVPSNQVNDVRHMISMKDLMLMTGGGLFIVDSTSGAISAATARPLQHSYTSVSRSVRPVAVERNVIYVEDRGAGMRDIEYSNERGGYGGKDLTRIARHLFDDNTIVDMCYQKFPHSLVWVVRDDGKMLVLTYVKDEDIYAWTQVDTMVGSNEVGFVKRCACIPEDQGDAVYIIVQRVLNGKVRYCIERMHQREYKDIQDLVMLDSSLTWDASKWLDYVTPGSSTYFTTEIPHGLVTGDYFEYRIWALGVDLGVSLNLKVGTVTDAFTFEGTLTSDDPWDTSGLVGISLAGYVRKQVSTVTGLDHLNGEDVTVIADGQIDQRNVTVTDGSISLVTVARAARIHIGLEYTALAETLEGEIDAQTMGTLKSPVRGVLRFRETVGGKIGISDTDLITIKESAATTLAVGETFSGSVEQVLHSSWSNSISVVVEQDAPLPMTLLSITTDVGLGD